MIQAYKNRHPLLAAFLSVFFTPMLVLLYLGRGRYALLYLSVWLILIALGFTAYYLVEDEQLYEIFSLTLDCLSILFSIVGVIHCFKAAKQYVQQDPPKLFERLSSKLIALLSFTFFPLLAVAVLVRLIIFEPYYTPSASSEPILRMNDTIIANKLSYGASRPVQRGDVIVFNPTSRPNVAFVHTVIAVAGETIQMKEGRVYLNGELIERKRISDYPAIPNQPDITLYKEIYPDGVTIDILEETDEGPLDNTEAFAVPDGHVFVMGNNRDNSSDSRIEKMTGFIPVENIIGKVEYLIWRDDGKGFRLQRIEELQSH